ncbi:MAG: 3-keto-disaccharide hydrolase [Planctomycetaceae bacterium]
MDQITVSRPWFVIVILILGVGIPAAWAWSEDTGDNQGFRPLFNGKDLTGWEATRPEMWSVRDGMIIGKQGNNQLKRNTFLATTESFSDFILKASIRLVKDRGNSGLQFRSVISPNGAAKGYQVDIGRYFWGLLLEEGGRGILKRPAREAVQQPGFVKVDEWNHLVITVKDHHIAGEMNGIKFLDLEDPTGELTGVIALQLHTGEAVEIHVKDVAIKELK